MTIEVKPLLVTITDAAHDQITTTLGAQEIKDLFLRVYVQGGCSGVTFGMALDNRSVEGDTEIEHNGIKVVVDRNSLEYVNGSTVDFDASGEKAGFKITNPNADLLSGESCGDGGCGTGGSCGSGGCC